MTETIVFSVIVWLCGIIFFIIGIFAWKRKTPMHFWSGTEVKESEISDIPAYNRANGIMWTVYSTGYLISGCLALVRETYAGILLLVALCFPGIILLVYTYQKIYRCYASIDSGTEP